MSTMFWIWMAAAIVFLIIELATPSFFFICFTLGAAMAGIYGQFYPESYPWQIGIFILVSAALLPLSRKFASRISQESPETSNVDRMINQNAIVIKEIDPDDPGQVRYQGEIWRAEAEDKIEKEAKVIILSISGTTVKVKRLDS